MNMLLESKSALKSNSLLVSSQAHQNYPALTFPTQIIKINQKESYDCLVTNVDIVTGELHIQFLTLIPTYSILSNYQEKFQKFYNQTDKDSLFPVSQLSQVAKQDARLASVCKHKNKFLRCEIISEKIDPATNEVKYVVSLIVEPNNIYRPLHQVIERRLAFKFILDLPTTDIKDNYAADLYKLAFNKLMSIRVKFISENNFLVGDLYDKKLNLKATDFLRNPEVMYDMRDSLMHTSSGNYLPFYLPEDYLINQYKVNFLCMDEFNIVSLFN